MEYKKADIVKLKIEKAIFQAKYLAHLENGEVVLLDGFSYPGEEVEAVLVKHKKQYWEGKILKIINKNNLVRVDAKCPYYEKCGGCQYQHLKYENQLELKKAILLENLEKFAKLKEYKIEEIIPSQNEIRYRNKSELNFIDDDKYGFALGQCYRGEWRKIVDMDDCLLFPEEIQFILKIFRKWKEKYDLSSFNRYKYIGFLRHLIMRHSYYTDEWMIILDTSDDWPEFFQNKDKLDDIKLLFNDFIQELKEKINLKSVYWRLTKLHRKKGESYEDYLVFGEKYIHEKLLDLEYKIKSDAFFQNNTLQAENLIKTALDYTIFKDDEKLNILDLYCGVGTFSLPLAKKFFNSKIVALELVAGAIESAKENAKLNNLENLEFLLGDASKMVDDLKKYNFDLILVDPPRAGLTVKVIEFLLAMEAKEIIYVSCSPVTLSRDLALLAEKYNVERIKAVDLFPQTYHLETVVSLVRK